MSRRHHVGLARPSSDPGAPVPAGRRRGPDAGVLPLPPPGRARPRRAERVPRSCPTCRAGPHARGGRRGGARSPSPGGRRAEVARAPARRARQSWFSRHPRDPVRALGDAGSCGWACAQVALRGHRGLRPRRRGHRARHVDGLGQTDLPARCRPCSPSTTCSWNWYESRAAASAPRRARAPCRGLPLPPLRPSAGSCALPHGGGPSRRPSASSSIAIGRPGLELIPSGSTSVCWSPRRSTPGPPRVMFTGTMSYPPNGQGARWLIEEVWPLVRRRLPGAALHRGPRPGSADSALGGRDGAVRAGRVPSMAPYFGAAHVVAAPILTGAGVRVKIIEAFAAGRAVVSTSLGPEGLGLRAGPTPAGRGPPDRFATARDRPARRPRAPRGAGRARAGARRARLRLAGARRPAREDPLTRGAPRWCPASPAGERGRRTASSGAGCNAPPGSWPSTC